MDFSHEIVESYNRLKEALADLLVGHTSEVIVPQDGDYPLLVLETPSDSVGFAVMNGEPEPAFASAYDSFKHLYRQKHSTWKELNLSFIVCRTESESTHDAFFDSIETDAYFCRKYVVRLRSDPDELVQELRRLPFMPLPEGRAGGIMRPLSAQTLLQSLNVSAKLARQIIVPREYSATRIVDQLLTEKDPLPVISSNIDLNVQHQIQPKERTRIRSVEIKGFRAYRKKQKIDTDADVVVFYGPNGLGKTSFFDALDYVCTGRIGRYCRRRISPEEFMSLACHLGSSADEGYVSIEVSQGGKDISVRRSVADWNTAYIDNEKTDRANTLQALTLSDWGENKERIENLERLFRATHLFGQSEQELLLKFEKDSTLPSDLVHRMLALDDYASGLAKIKLIQDELDKHIAESKQQITLLNANANEVQMQIKALPSQHNTIETGKQLRDIAARLVKDLQEQLDVRVAVIEPSQASTREWRSIAESALKDAQDKLRQIQSIESGFAQFAQNRSALQHIADELSKFEVEFKEKNIKHKSLQQEMKKLSGSLEQEKAALAQVNSRQDNLAELGSLQEVFQKTNISLQHWRLELNQVAGEVDTTTAELLPLITGVESLRIRSAEIQEVVQGKLQQVHALAAIQAGLPSWEKNRANIVNLQKATVGAQSALKEISAAIDELKTGITAKEKELSTCEQEFRELTVHQLELTRLLDEIETHVENGTCPTCGIDHKSKAALVERIHARKQARPAHVDALANRCGDLRKILKHDKSLLDTRIGEHAYKCRELEKMTSELENVNKSVAAFERTIVEAGLPTDNQLVAFVSRKSIEENATLRLSQETLKNIESEFTKTSRRINELKKKQTLQTETQNRANATIVQLEQRIAALRAKAEASGMSLEMSPNEFTAESKATASRKAVGEERFHKLNKQIETLTQTVNVMEWQVREVKEKIKNLQQDKENLEKQLRRYEENAAPVIDRNALSLDVIVERKKQSTERVDNLDALRNRCINLERTVDAARRTALLAELEAKAQTLEKQKHTLVEAAERMSAVKKWFASLKDVLDRQSSRAVANHVEAFGPLTSLIQKRLRTVYGFGDVNLLAKKNEINVVVDWGTKHVKPADYFSDSQKQILMLSIFLAGRLTQTWSGFEPVMMDDPVTHFDDLNAFGFVELIRGFISTSPRKQQFFISTCEHRLFELMLKKFYSVEGGAKFYRFEGIASDGPIIKEADIIDYKNDQY